MKRHEFIRQKVRGGQRPGSIDGVRIEKDTESLESVVMVKISYTPSFAIDSFKA